MGLITASVRISTPDLRVMHHAWCSSRTEEGRSTSAEMTVAMSKDTKSTNLPNAVEGDASAAVAAAAAIDGAAAADYNVWYYDDCLDLAYY